jgi:RluA family pseudouridine synthase
MKKEKIKIIYEDKFIIVVDKPAHLLTIATEKEKDQTMYHKVLMYEKKKNKNNRIYIVHRLDKDTSGLLLFAKDEKTKEYFQNNWTNVIRKYVAVVEGKVEKKEDTIKSYIKEEKNFISHSSNKDGKLAITNYKLLNTSKSYSLLEIDIKTGRKNQIRVHMKEMNHPIIGDKKYGSKTNPLKRLGLHANILEFIHPITKETIHLESKIPDNFILMFPKK